MIISFDPDRIRDRLDIDYHGGFFTHLDAVCHVVYGGKLYNGHDMRETVTDGGCEHLGITGLRNGVVTKAVLVDVPARRQAGGGVSPGAGRSIPWAGRRASSRRGSPADPGIR